MKMYVFNALARLALINTARPRSIVAARAAAAVMRDRLEDAGVYRHTVRDAHVLAEWALVGPRLR